MCRSEGCPKVALSDNHVSDRKSGTTTLVPWLASSPTFYEIGQLASSLVAIAEGGGDPPTRRILLRLAGTPTAAKPFTF